MKRLFVSCPMRGRTEEAIRETYSSGKDNPMYTAEELQKAYQQGAEDAIDFLFSHAETRCTDCDYGDECDEAGGCLQIFKKKFKEQNDVK